MALPTLKIDPSGSLTAVLDGVEGTSISPRDCALLAAYVLIASHSVDGIHPDSNLTDVNIAVENSNMVITWKQYDQDQRVEYGASSAPYAQALLDFIHQESPEDITRLKADIINALNHAETRISNLIMGG